MLHKIKTVTKKELSSGKTVYVVVLEDGQQGSSWDAEFEAADGKELDFDITPNQKNSQYLDFKIKRAKGFNNAPKNYKPDALMAAATFCAPRLELKSTEVVKLAEVFHAWIRSS